MVADELRPIHRREFLQLRSIASARTSPKLSGHRFLCGLETFRNVVAVTTNGTGSVDQTFAYVLG